MHHEDEQPTVQCNTLHTAHCTLHCAMQCNTYCTLHCSIKCTSYLNCSLLIATQRNREGCIIKTSNPLCNTIHCAMHAILCNAIKCTLHIVCMYVHCTLLIADHCTLKASHSALKKAHCTLHCAMQGNEMHNICTLHTTLCNRHHVYIAYSTGQNLHCSHVLKMGEKMVCMTLPA